MAGTGRDIAAELTEMRLRVAAWEALPDNSHKRYRVFPTLPRATILYYLRRAVRKLERGEYTDVSHEIEAAAEEARRLRHDLKQPIHALDLMKELARVGRYDCRDLEHDVDHIAALIRREIPPELVPEPIRLPQR